MGSKSSSPISKRNKKRDNIQSNKGSDDDWILECIIEYIQSTECSIFVDGFIDEHCLVFEANTNDSEINQEYHQIHSQYKEMIENVLLSRLSKLGLNAQQLTVAIQKAQQTQIHPRIKQYISAILDFNVFKHIMIQRNVFLEQEAIKYLSSRYAQNALNVHKSVDISNMSEEEQLKLALSQSLAVQQQLSIPEPQELIPSAPSMNSDEMNQIPTHVQIEGNVELECQQDETNSDPLDIMSNINMSQPKRVSLEPLKLQREQNASFEGINKMEADLPTLTAASIKNIKMKQSAKHNPLLLEQKQMILNIRKQKRNKEMKTIQRKGPGFDLEDEALNVAKQSALPPLHKSFVRKNNTEL